MLFVCPGLLGDRARWAEAYPEERLLAGRASSRRCPALGHGAGRARLGPHPDGRHGRARAASGTSAVPGRAGGRDRRAGSGLRLPLRHARPRRPARAVAAAGYDVAFAVAREHGRFAVDRVFVQSTDSLFAFRLKLSGGYRLVSGGAGWAAALAAAARVRLRCRAGAARAEALDRSARGAGWRTSQAASRGSTWGALVTRSAVIEHASRRMRSAG